MSLAFDMPTKSIAAHAKASSTSRGWASIVSRRALSRHMMMYSGKMPIYLFLIC